MESLDVVAVLQWFVGLPAKAAVALAGAYALILLGRRALDYVVVRAAQNPEKELRADLLRAYREVRREIKGLKRELAEAYEETRQLALELQRFRENLSAIRADIHRLRAEHPEAEPALRIVGKRLDGIHEGN